MKFKYKISVKLYIMFIALFIVSAACLVWNVVRLVGFIKDPTIVTVYNYISVGICILLPILCVLFVATIMASSYYKIADGKLLVRYGVLKDSFNLKEIDNIVRDLEKKSLIITFKDESGFRIVIDEKNFNDFAAALMKAEPSISYAEYTGDVKKDDEK